MKFYDFFFCFLSKNFKRKFDKEKTRLIGKFSFLNIFSFSCSFILSNQVTLTYFLIVLHNFTYNTNYIMYKKLKNKKYKHNNSIIFTMFFEKILCYKFTLLDYLIFSVFSCILVLSSLCKTTHQHINMCFSLLASKILLKGER